MENVIEKRFDPTEYQTYHKGEIYKIVDLSRDDLLQLVCEGMQAVAMLERIIGNASQVVEDWNDGKIMPDPEPEQEAAQQCLVAADSLDRMLTPTASSKKTSQKLKDIAEKLAN